MSIWCSHETVGHDQFGDDPPNGDVRSYASGWSNHYPTIDGQVEQPASVDLAHVPAWCVPGWEQDGNDAEHWGKVGPWLRLDVDSVHHDWNSGGKPTSEPEMASVVLDEAAVRALYTQLRDWLAQPKVRPR